jgi:hypothetical protein
MTDDLDEPPRFGAGHRRAAELGDAELRAEVEARRLREAATAERGAVHEPTLSNQRRAQYFANLELSSDAGPAEVAAAHDRLAARYTPGRLASAAQQRDATEELLRSLAEARDALLAHFRRR